MAVADTFKALGDPIRLEMVQRLSGGSPQTVSTVSSGLGISRQGARKHLQILAEAELVTLEPQGREVLVQLNTRTLESSRAFFAELERRWDLRLNALREFVEKDNGPGKP